MMDIVTVYHNQRNKAWAANLLEQIRLYEAPGSFTFVAWSNMEENLGFAKGCNRGAARGSDPIIGFLNPDVEVSGPFIGAVHDVFVRDPDVMVTGMRFGKPDEELREWGVKNWVCGATFFVRRTHFEALGGFDERFEWSFEETDFIRRTEQAGFKVLDIDLPLHHESPADDSPEDRRYKRHHAARGSQLFHAKWGS